MRKINFNFNADNDFASICIHLSRFLSSSSVGEYALSEKFLHLINEKTELVQYLIATNQYMQGEYTKSKEAFNKLYTSTKDQKYLALD